MSTAPSPERDALASPGTAAPAAADAVPASTAPANALVPMVEYGREPTLEDFDPADYDWVPVKRKPRRDGWTVEAQRRFIETLADTGSVTCAAREVNMALASCYRLRRAPDGRAFAAAWAAALHTASQHLADLAFDRAVNGSSEPVFDRDGNRTGERIRYNDRLLMFLLRAHQPGRYDGRRGGAPAATERERPAALPTVEAALDALAPPTPAAPHRLMPPEAAIDAMQIADICDGRPRPPLADPALDDMPLGRDFEALLADAKRAACGLPPLSPLSPSMAGHRDGRGDDHDHDHVDRHDQDDTGAPGPAARNTRTRARRRR